MSNALKIIGGVLVVAVVGVLGAASMQPDTYHVERSITLAASPADVFPYANDFTLWAKWNPFDKKDPNVKHTLSATTTGVGASDAWEGNKDVGKGIMTIAESVPDQKVVHELHFIEPFDDTGMVTMSMAAEGDGTKFTWAMDGDMNMMSKVMCLFSPMDAMLGPSFEEGFAMLKPLAEADAKTRIEAEKAAAAAAAEAAAAAAAAAPVQGAPI